MADTPQAQDDGNGRVRQAERLVRIEEKIDRLLMFQGESSGDRRDLHRECDLIVEHVQAVEKDVVRLQEQQTTLAKWTATLAVASPTLAGVIGWFFGNK